MVQRIHRVTLRFGALRLQYLCPDCGEERVHQKSDPGEQIAYCAAQCCGSGIRCLLDPWTRVMR
jgi:hypothetical protein